MGNFFAQFNRSAVFGVSHPSLEVWIPFFCGWHSAPPPFKKVRFIALRLWYAGIALCFPIFGIFLPIYCAILFFERNILTFVAQSVKIVVKGQLALALTFMESRYGDG